RILRIDFDAPRARPKSAGGEGHGECHSAAVGDAGADRRRYVRDGEVPRVGATYGERAQRDGGAAVVVVPRRRERRGCADSPVAEVVRGGAADRKSVV